MRTTVERLEEVLDEILAHAGPELGLPLERLRDDLEAEAEADGDDLGIRALYEHPEVIRRPLLDRLL